MKSGSGRPLRTATLEVLPEGRLAVGPPDESVGRKGSYRRPNKRGLEKTSGCFDRSRRDKLLQVLYKGIDVSTTALDMALLSKKGGEPLTLSDANNEEGIEIVLKRLKEVSPTLVVLEATGGLEIPLVGALGASEIPVAVVNPRQVRDFAKAKGILAKTDAIDAAVLAMFAEAIRPVPRPLKDEQMQELEALVTRRRQLVDMLTAEQNRLIRAPQKVRNKSR